MGSKKLALGMMLFWTGGCEAGLGAEVLLRPLSYQEGFEGPAPKVTLWATNGEAEVHFLGPSEEQACAGKRSLKLDATLKSGSFHYWGVAALTRGEAAGKPFLIYTPRAITDTPLTEKVFPIPASPGAALTCSGCPGEYESVSAAIYALQDLSELRVSASDLTGPAGRVPAEAVDISIVKSWYQAGREISDLTHKAYVPELLLKDDALVRVDPEKEENYVRSTERDGAATYLLCSGPTSENLAGVRPLDARRLQPVAVRAYSLRQFWLTVQIPKKAPAGTYRGAVRFQAASGQQQIPLEVTVHPFDLLPPRLIYSIYYRPSLSLDGPTAINSDVKSEEQYRAEMEDLKAHGVWYPANYQGMDVSGSNQATQSRLRRALQIRQEVGLPGGPFYNVGCGTGATTDPDELAALQQAVKKWLDFCRPFGFTEVYFYGSDEATGERLIAQRSSWKAVQEAGGKTFVAGSEGTFEAMGKLLNCAVLVGKPDSEEAKKWHSVGSHAFCYAYPQVGNEEPERYRRNFGLVLWKAGFDGAMNYAYQHAFGHIWNDFDSPHYRDHNFTYPTVDGVVGTIQWEGFREAVDDVRYVTTLEQVIATAPEEKKSLARRAQEWLENLNPETADLYETRAAMVEWIKRLKG